MVMVYMGLSVSHYSERYRRSIGGKGLALKKDVELIQHPFLMVHYKHSYNAVDSASLRSIPDNC